MAEIAEVMSLDSEVDTEKILSKVDCRTFDKGDWNRVVKECDQLAANWERLSTFLGLGMDQIAKIKKDNQQDCTSCLSKALEDWVKQNHIARPYTNYKPSWRTLLQAIAEIDRLAFKKLAEHHQVGTQGVPAVKTDGKDDVAESNKEGSNDDTMIKRPFVAEPHKGFTPLARDRKLIDPSLSKEEKEKLHGRQYIDSEDMMYKFQKFFTATTKSLQDRNITASELSHRLGLLGSIRPTFEDPTLDLRVPQNPPRLRHRLQELSSAKTIGDAMFVVQDYCSFFSYRMLEHIINELGTDKDKSNLAEYEKEFAEYGKKYLFPCPFDSSKTNEEDITMLVILDGTFDDCTVDHISSFIGKLQRILSVPSNNTILPLKLCRTEPGSVKLIFQLPDFVQQDIFPLTSDQEASLASLGVIELSCGDYQYLCQDTSKGDWREIIEKGKRCIALAESVYSDITNNLVDNAKQKLNHLKRDAEELSKHAEEKAKEIQEEEEQYKWNIEDIQRTVSKLRLQQNELENQQSRLQSELNAKQSVLDQMRQTLSNAESDLSSASDRLSRARKREQDRLAGSTWFGAVLGTIIAPGIGTAIGAAAGAGAGASLNAIIDEESEANRRVDRCRERCRDAESDVQSTQSKISAIQSQIGSLSSQCAHLHYQREQSTAKATEIEETVAFLHRASQFWKDFQEISVVGADSTEILQSNISKARETQNLEWPISLSYEMYGENKITFLEAWALIGAQCERVKDHAHS